MCYVYHVFFRKNKLLTRNLNVPVRISGIYYFIPLLLALQLALNINSFECSDANYHYVIFQLFFLITLNSFYVFFFIFSVFLIMFLVLIAFIYFYFCYVFLLPKIC